MEYKKINLGSYNLHLINTDRFKTITVRVLLRKESNKEEITLRNFLNEILNYSSGTYKTKRELVLRTQELYGVSIGATTDRGGNYSNINFYLTMLNEKYTEKGMLDQSLGLLSDVLFNPNVKNNEFDKDSFNNTMQIEKVYIEALKENPSKYATIRLFESLDKDMPYTSCELGTIEQLNKIDRKNLYDFYKKVINESLVDVFVIGKIDFDETEKLIKKHMKFNTLKRNKIDPIIEQTKFDKTKEVIEEEPISQSNLAIASKIKKLNKYERNYVLSIYNMILGGCAESKFFNNIREKYSLAYHISSSVRKLDNLMIIKAGIANENYKKVLELINKEMKDMEKGNFTEEDIEKAKNKYISFLEEVKDSPNAITETYVAKDLLDIGEIEERLVEIKKVTKEEIMKVAKNISIDTIYLLKGTLENEGN